MFLALYNVIVGMVLWYDVIFGQFILYISLLFITIYFVILWTCYSTTVTTITANIWSHMRRLRRVSSSLSRSFLLQP